MSSFVERLQDKASAGGKADVVQLECHPVAVEMTDHARHRDFVPAVAEVPPVPLRRVAHSHDHVSAAVALVAGSENGTGWTVVTSWSVEG